MKPQPKPPGSGPAFEGFPEDRPVLSLAARRPVLVLRRRRHRRREQVAGVAGAPSLPRPWDWRGQWRPPRSRGGRGREGAGGVPASRAARSRARRSRKHPQRNDSERSYATRDIRENHLCGSRP